jgi:hypothetical protein
MWYTTYTSPFIQHHAPELGMDDTLLQVGYASLWGKLSFLSNFRSCTPA